MNITASAFFFTAFMQWNELLGWCGFCATIFIFLAMIWANTGPLD